MKGLNISPKSTGFLTEPDWTAFEVTNIGFKIDVLYVHKLQNLYFELRGEELTLNHITHDTTK